MRYYRHNIHTAEIHSQQSQSCLSSVDKHTDNGRKFAFGRRSSKRPDCTVHQQLQNSQKKNQKKLPGTSTGCGRWHISSSQQKHTAVLQRSIRRLGCAAGHTEHTWMTVLGGWDVQQDTWSTCGSSQAEPLEHPAPALTGMVQAAPHSIAHLKQSSAPLPLCCCSFLPLVVYTIFQHLLENFLTNSAGKQGAGEPPWPKHCGGPG